MGANRPPQSAEDKWRRSKAYPRVYALLIQAAEQRRTVTYGQIAEIMGLPPAGNLMGSMVGVMLGLVTETEHRCARPMLSAVVVSSTNQMPGSGFYGLAEANGSIPPGASNEDKRAFWQKERDRVYEEWSS